MNKILDDIKARKACVGLVKKLVELGISSDVISEIHCEVGELVKVGIEIGIEQTIRTVFAETTDVKANRFVKNI